MKGCGKREIPEKTRRLTASSGTIPNCESPVTRPGIEPGLHWWEASSLTAQPSWKGENLYRRPGNTVRKVGGCELPDCYIAIDLARSIHSVQNGASRKGENLYRRPGNTVREVGGCELPDCYIAIDLAQTLVLCGLNTSYNYRDDRVKERTKSPSLDVKAISRCFLCPGYNETLSMSSKVSVVIGHSRRTGVCDCSARLLSPLHFTSAHSTRRNLRRGHCASVGRSATSERNRVLIASLPQTEMQELERMLSPGAAAGCVARSSAVFYGGGEKITPSSLHPSLCHIPDRDPWSYIASSSLATSQMKVLSLTSLALRLNPSSSTNPLKVSWGSGGAVARALASQHGDSVESNKFCDDGLTNGSVADKASGDVCQALSAVMSDDTYALQALDRQPSCQVYIVVPVEEYIPLTLNSFVVQRVCVTQYKRQLCGSTSAVGWISSEVNVNEILKAILKKRKQSARGQCIWLPSLKEAVQMGRETYLKDTSTAIHLNGRRPAERELSSEEFACRAKRRQLPAEVYTPTSCRPVVLRATKEWPFRRLHQKQSGNPAAPASFTRWGRENPPTNRIVQHDSYVRKSRSDPAGDWSQFVMVGGEQSNSSATAAPAWSCGRRDGETGDDASNPPPTPPPPPPTTNNAVGGRGLSSGVGFAVHRPRRIAFTSAGSSVSLLPHCPASVGPLPFPLESVALPVPGPDSGVCVVILQLQRAISHMHREEQQRKYSTQVQRLARRGDEVLGLRDSVARIVVCLGKRRNTSGPSVRTIHQTLAWSVDKQRCWKSLQTAHSRRPISPQTTWFGAVAGDLSTAQSVYTIASCTHSVYLIPARRPTADKYTQVGWLGGCGSFPVDSAGLLVSKSLIRQRGLCSGPRGPSIQSRMLPNTGSSGLVDHTLEMCVGSAHLHACSQLRRRDTHVSLYPRAVPPTDTLYHYLLHLPDTRAIVVFDIDESINHRPTHSRIIACGNRAGRWRWSAGFLSDLPLPPSLSFQRCSTPTSITLIGSQDLAVKSSPNTFTRSLTHSTNGALATSGAWLCYLRRLVCWSLSAFNLDSDRPSHRHMLASSVVSRENVSRTQCKHPDLQVLFSALQTPKKSFPQGNFASSVYILKIHLLRNDTHTGFGTRKGELFRAEAGKEWNCEIWATLNIVVLRANVGEARRVWSSVGMQGRGKRKTLEKTHRPASSSGTIPMFENQGETRRELNTNIPHALVRNQMQRTEDRQIWRRGETEGGHYEYARAHAQNITEVVLQRQQMFYCGASRTPDQWRTKRQLHGRSAAGLFQLCIVLYKSGTTRLRYLHRRLRGTHMTAPSHADIHQPTYNTAIHLNPFISGAAVAERLACSPPTKANRVQSPAAPLPDFRMWESYRMLPLDFVSVEVVRKPRHSAVLEKQKLAWSSILNRFISAHNGAKMKIWFHDCLWALATASELEKKVHLFTNCARLKSTVLFILEPPPFLHWLLTKRYASPLQRELNVIRAHDWQMFIYWRRITQDVSSKVWFSGKPIAKRPETFANSVTRRLDSAALCTHMQHMQLLTVHWLSAVTVEGDDWTSVLQEVSNIVWTNG
ncbi:hypothetical protein PR048_031005 [Dryococelus australis]|uniref:Uncharacterized protein n=1 Tax=Dryococelus australis TaxID=614101 RepID=A0ABQ9G441_9NEOP|nr:hypothetical protein PR048_031005 [Dryococelus australis]